MRFAAGRSAAIAVLLVLLAAGLATPVASQSEAATTMHIALEPDADAVWTVSARFELAGDNETAAFDRLAEEYVAGESDPLSVEPYRSAASAASEATGREMAISNVTRAADRANDTGELRLSFVWSNFTRVEAGGERLVLGDVFTTPSGTWLPGLGADQDLVIQFPPGYVVESVSQPLDNRTIRVVGPASFEPGQPSAELRRSGQVTTSPGSGSDAFLGVPSALSVGAALAVLLVAGYLVYRRREVDEEAVPGAGVAPPDEELADDELLSDEERVLQLLRAEGGRMKQVDIVEETDWSNAKVSQLLSSMAEAGQIEKLRIGRENLISLPDRDEE